MDKYAPRSFLELLGDEEINREVVRWLKSWDRCVFGKDSHRRVPKSHAAAAGKGPAIKQQQGADARPPQKILLVHGSPGELARQPHVHFLRCAVLRWMPSSEADVML